MGIKKIRENVYEIEKEGKMLVPGIVFASEKLMVQIRKEKETIKQVKNVASLPGIVGKSIAMSDAHMGYGFSVGAVAAFDLKKGIVSPGGVGYDINCGVRLLTTSLKKEEFLKKREQVMNEMYKNVPSGVGKGGLIRLSDSDIEGVLNLGSEWALEKGYALKEDLEHTEDNGKIDGANALKVSIRAKARGRNQLGTIGSGNHFLEIQEIEKVFDKKTADVFGLEVGKIVVMIHTGSRGLGHQNASDYIKRIEDELGTGDLPDRQLACAPIDSELGRDYLAAMRAAANFAFVNRQVITHNVRKSFEKFFGKIEINVVYDVAHNIAKFEKFNVGELCVHRKGATRSFGPGRRELPRDYRKIGQPILIPGSMGTSSYVLVGTKEAEEISFASTAHGAGRVMSRSAAKRDLNLDEVKKELKDRNVLLKAGSDKGILEEAPEAYKDVDEVVRVSDALGIGKLIARLLPLGVVKG